jgi:hypothetical protein
MSPAAGPGSSISGAWEEGAPLLWRERPRSHLGVQLLSISRSWAAAPPKAARLEGSRRPWTRTTSRCIPIWEATNPGKPLD